MSIVNYGNRVKFKKKSAIEIEFRKSSNYKIPPGYRSMDICIIGGGASGFFGTQKFTSQTDSSGSHFRTSTYNLPPGGNGAYVRNLYNKELNTDDIYVEIGDGGVFNGIPDFYLSSMYDKKHNPKYWYDVKRNIITCGGKDTFIKNNKNGEILYSAPGAKGYLDYEKYRSKTINELIMHVAGGGNLGGNGTISSYDDRYLRNSYNDVVYHFPKNINHYTAPYQGCTQGYPYWPNASKYTSLTWRKEYIISYEGSSEIYYMDWPIVVGNKMIDIDGYGETRIFNDGKFIAGGGCAHNFYAYYDGGEQCSLLQGQTSGDYTNTDGGGDSAIIKRHNDTSKDYSFEVIRQPGNGKPNTGGGGASGVSYITKKTPLQYVNLCFPGNGANGLCVIRLYTDEKRQKVNFIEGINKFIIQ